MEEPLHLAGALTGIQGTIIVDCLSLWVSNQLMVRRSDDDVLRAADALVAAAALHRGLVVFVTNEVGSGVVPDNDLARRYRDLLGWVNQKVAHASSDAWLLARDGTPIDALHLDRTVRRLPCIAVNEPRARTTSEAGAGTTSRVMSSMA